MLLQQSGTSPIVGSIARLLEPWQSLYSEHTSISTLVLFVHLAALVASAGLAVANDRAIVGTKVTDSDERVRKLAELSVSHRSVISALVISFASGLLLLLADFEAFVGMPAFWLKMSLILVLVTNAWLMQRREALIKTTAAGPLGLSSPLGGNLWAGLRRQAWTSLTLWFAIVLAGTAMTSS